MPDLLAGMPLETRAWMLLAFVAIMVAAAGITVLVGVRRQQTASSRQFAMPAASGLRRRPAKPRARGAKKGAAEPAPRLATVLEPTAVQSTPRLADTSETAPADRSWQ